MSDVFRRLGAAPRTRREALTPSPVFLVILAVAVGGAALTRWAGTTHLQLAGVGVFLLVIAGWVVSLCLHEYAHAVLAYRAGDTDVLSAGYLTLNPLRYANPLFSLLLPVVFIIAGGIGLPGGAVYLHRHRFRTRALASAVALAGPLTNVVFALALLLPVAAHARSGTASLDGVWSGLAFLGFLQTTAAVLNLLPIPGLDGWAAVEPFVSRDTADAARKLAPFGMIAVFAVLFVPAINRVFFDLVHWLFDRTGAPQQLAAVGQTLFKFWRLADVRLAG